ncbi:MAG: flagellar biosynthesis protein FlhF, partial [Hydrogenophaga sp.]|nr:flagellar biosynthesis protein FlhF [Hydrogenophaga sp.]
MNIQRFTAPTSREAMAKARNAFGDSAVILSSRSTGDGFEVMAAAEESLAPMAPQTPQTGRGERLQPIVTRPSAGRAAQPLPTGSDSVEEDTEALSMSTLSFQEYVRERMLRKRRAALSGEPVAPQAPQTAVAPEPRRMAAEPRAASPIQV